MSDQNRRDPTKSKKQQKPASADTMAKTTEKGSVELNEEQLGGVSGGKYQWESNKKL